ncbi:unnamed protein product [Onchocerca ochengi]|uniref:Integrase_H2C2 domain-containing protein n=1 Tax=Onchocerca ochengi TaxID=42157 RepID=A0A182EX67_ONCOC|nr:unnamed protein product [Onchocerca ochengi]
MGSICRKAPLLAHDSAHLLARELDSRWHNQIERRWRSNIGGLIVKYYHEKSFHASVHYTRTKMREQYWIPHGRVYIKKILRKICKGCAMCVVSPFGQPDSAPYPTARVTATRRFETFGVNFFGPIIIMENHAKTKRW